MLYPLFFNEALRSACAPVYFNVSDFLTAVIHNLRPDEAESFRGHIILVTVDSRDLEFFCQLCQIVTKIMDTSLKDRLMIMLISL